MLGTILLSIFVILGILLVAVGIADDQEGPFCVGVLSGIAALIIFIGLMIGPSDIVDSYIVNKGDKPLKVYYVQYHAFSDNTCEECVICPGQMKKLHKTKIIEKVDYEFNPADWK